MRIALITTNLGLGGISAYVEYTALALAHEGIPCLIITDRAPHDRLDKLANSGIEIRAYTEPQDMSVYQRDMQSFRADLMHMHIWERYEPLLFLGKLCSLPLIFHVHFELHAGFRMWSDRLLRFRRDAWFLNMFFSWRTAINCIDLYLCCSHSAERSIRRRFWPCYIRSKTIHNAVPSRSQLPIKEIKGNPSFLQVGNLIPLKNPLLTLRVYKAVKQVNKNASLSFAGDGFLKKEMESYIIRNELEDVHLLGRVRDMSSVYATHNILVMPSDTEALPYTLLEASACGMPVIASRAGGIPEVIENNFNGILFRVGDEESFLKACLLLAADPEKRVHMGLQGVEMARNRFNIESMIPKLIDVYEDTIKEHCDA